MKNSPRSSLLENLQWSLLTPGDRVLVAVSGGPDSLSLLHALHCSQEAFGLASVEAAHLDHGLRGDESATEAKWVADWCAERGIACTVGYADVAAMAKTQKRGKQETARAARYDFLAATAEAVRATKIATAHTQDDQIETVLLNILRGAGSDGLRGIPVVRDLHVRPLLGVSRVDIEEYCRENSLTPRRDPSNLSPDSYTRNRLRLDLLPKLARDYNPSVGSALLRLSEIAMRDSDYLRLQAEAALEEATLNESAHQRVLSLARLAALHPALLRYALREAISAVRGTREGIAYHHIERLCDLISRTKTTRGLIRLSGLFPTPHCDVAIGPGSLILTRTLTPDLRLKTSSIGWKLQVALKPLPGTLQAQMDEAMVDRESLHLRTWQMGDKIAPIGMGGHHKKLSAIFTDAKVPVEERAHLPIVADRSGILWVAGYALADRAKVTMYTKQTLFLSLTETIFAQEGKSLSTGE